jgi:threonine aldolase
MRKAMAIALVGDERNGTDPTVNMLNQTVAELLGKEACIFVPSGTMCNLLSVFVHCNRGNEIICDKSAHIYITMKAVPTLGLRRLEWLRLKVSEGFLLPSK